MLCVFVVVNNAADEIIVHAERLVDSTVDTIHSVCSVVLLEMNN